MPETVIRFRAGDVELDGRLSLPPAATRACVVCHPHPLYGGDMHNPVVVATTDALRKAAVATLRFDFRGVGASTGSHGGGSAEVDDARAALDALADATGLPRIAIAGYSFGSIVALRLAASDNRVAAVAAIAPPLGMMDAAFAREIVAPLLAVAGDRDEYCPRSAFDEFTAAPGRSGTLVAGADHFLGGREREVAAAVAGFVSVV